MSLNESIVEDAALTWFGELGYAIAHGPQLAPGEAAAERRRSVSRSARWCWRSACAKPSAA